MVAEHEGVGARANPTAVTTPRQRDTCGVGDTIPADATCHKSLLFRPQAVGMRRANLIIDSPQLASLAILQLSGNGQAAAAVNYEGNMGRARRKRLGNQLHAPRRFDLRVMVHL